MRHNKSLCVSCVAIAGQDEAAGRVSRLPDFRF